MLYYVKKGTCTCHRYCVFININVNTNIVDFFADLIGIHAHAHTFKIAISNNVTDTSKYN